MMEGLQDRKKNKELTKPLINNQNTCLPLVCQMVQQGVAAIVGPNDPSVAAHIQSMSEVLKVPLIETR